MRRARTTPTQILATIRALVAFVVLVAQVGIVGAGVLDGREGASAASHFENGGTELHFAHNEADCFMCRAQHLNNAAPFDPQASLEVIPVAPQLHVSVVEANAAIASSLRSRAPPVT